MKIAFVYLTLNSTKIADWNSTLSLVDEQTQQVDMKLLLDSESDDNTVDIGKMHGWEIYPIKRAEFNHGKSRDTVMRFLDDQGFDIVVFASHDIQLATKDSLANLITFMKNNSVALAYGRQITSQGVNSLNRWQRERYYGKVSTIKTQKDIAKLGLMTPFCSTAYCACNIKECLQHGGFPTTNFGEDMLLAAKIILARGAIGYCAESQCLHEHSDNLFELFKRGLAVGKFHKNNPWLIEKFGSVSDSNRAIPKSISLWPQFAAKVLGYFTGKYLFSGRYS